MFKKNGSAVDAAVAVMLCVGIMNMHSSGIGGGGFMLVYKRGSKSAEVIDFREEAPGPSASGVPGEIKGYYTAWQKYGRLSWREVVQPAIDLAKKGVPLGKTTYKAMILRKDYIFNDTGLREIFVKENGDFLKEGDLMNLTKLAKTLETIQDKPDDFYTGELARQIVQDVRENGGIITLEDMRKYKVKVRKSIGGKLDADYWYSVPPPASGAVLGLILNILKGYNMTAVDKADTKRAILTYHRIIEAFKFAYAYRALLGDQDYVNLTDVGTLPKMIDPHFAETLRLRINDNKTFTNISYYGGYYSSDGGSTTHMSLLAPNGDAVSITSTVNLYFGCKYRSPTTGIIMNNQMDDFSTPGKLNFFKVPPSPANFIKPGKRPLSSSSPSVIVDQSGNVRIVAGAAGGTTITTSTAL
ncbi:hypothetical protein QZH41_014394, partial [Actinostola sp. cb2023]